MNILTINQDFDETNFVCGKFLKTVQFFFHKSSSFKTVHSIPYIITIFRLNNLHERSSCHTACFSGRSLVTVVEQSTNFLTAITSNYSMLTHGIKNGKSLQI